MTTLQPAGPLSRDRFRRGCRVELFRRFFSGHPLRAARPEEIEPEFVAIAPDGSYALVTLQEQSAVAVIDLAVLNRMEPGSRPEENGKLPARLDRKVVGANAGARPETLRFTPDGRTLLVAAERDGGTLAVIEME